VTGPACRFADAVLARKRVQSRPRPARHRVFPALRRQEPLPDLEQKIVGFAFVLIGLTVFVRGLAMSLFPMGEGLAHSLAERGSVLLLLAFAFALGFGSTFAEPALGAVIATAAEIAAAEALVAPDPNGARTFAAALRLGISGGVGLGVAIGTLRIVLGLARGAAGPGRLWRRAAAGARRACRGSAAWLSTRERRRPPPSTFPSSWRSALAPPRSYGAATPWGRFRPGRPCERDADDRGAARRRALLPLR
jgi:Protein of unknown function (DUF1538)